MATFNVKVWAELSGVTEIQVEADDVETARELAETEASAEDFIPNMNKNAELYLEKITQVCEEDGETETNTGYGQGY